MYVEPLSADIVIIELFLFQFKILTFPMGLKSILMWFLKTRQVSYSILEHYVIEFQHQYKCTKFVVILATLPKAVSFCNILCIFHKTIAKLKQKKQSQDKMNHSILRRFDLN